MLKDSSTCTHAQYMTNDDYMCVMTAVNVQNQEFQPYYIHFKFQGDRLLLT